MQISRVNSTNFKGLWEIGKEQDMGSIKRIGSRIFLREVIYHPFSDESQNATEQAIKNAKEKMACIQYPAEDPCFSGNFIVTEPTLGKRLSITEKQYDEISNMQNTPYYVDSQSAYCSAIEGITPEVKEIINKVV